GVVASTLSINPLAALVQCEPAHISWPATKGPYDVIVVDAADPCVLTSANTNVTSITWTVDIASSKTTKYYISVADGDDNEAWTQELTVGASNTTACLNNAASSSSSALGETSTEPTETVEAAGAAVTGGSSDGCFRGSNGAAALHMNPIMALCAVFAWV
ncbi:hypothetical protein B0H11DRAFT_2067772, partial [Mycena galericulata]